VKDSVGFCDVLPLVKATQPDPSFFSHSQLVGVLVELSVKATESGAVPDSGVPEKSATGAPNTVNVPLPVNV
jgi:hypothetical protein